MIGIINGTINYEGNVFVYTTMYLPTAQHNLVHNYLQPWAPIWFSYVSNFSATVTNYDLIQIKSVKMFLKRVHRVDVWFWSQFLTSGGLHVTWHVYLKHCWEIIDVTSNCHQLRGTYFVILSLNADWWSILMQLDIQLTIVCHEFYIPRVLPLHFSWFVFYYVKLRRITGRGCVFFKFSYEYAKQ